MIGPGGDAALPRVVKFGHDDLRVATQFTDGVLTGVSVWVVEPGHETMASSAGVTRYAISVDGRRVTLPLSAAEMVRALGEPAGHRKDY